MRLSHSGSVVFSLSLSLLPAFSLSLSELLLRLPVFSLLFLGGVFLEGTQNLAFSVKGFSFFLQSYPLQQSAGFVQMIPSGSLRDRQEIRSPLINSMAAQFPNLKQIMRCLEGIVLCVINFPLQQFENFCHP